MKRISWLIVIAASLALGRPAQFDGDATGSADFERLVLAPAVADNLALLFAQFDTELVLCLEGEARGDVLYVNDYRMPHILASEPGRVQAAGCRKDGNTIGTWHNHPSPGLSFTGGPEALARNCYLSRTDIRDFLRREDALVSVVSCAPRTYAYWWRQDVREDAERLALLPAPADQLVQALPHEGRGASDLTQARSR